ncbi:MAG: CcoQ/FixQ family Cbb3-type cytochrome c oxidase assembly chaperone [Pseudobdellovibrio sp.]
MKQDGLKYFTDTYLTSIGLMLFFTFFVVVVFWVFRKGSKQFYNRTALIPFEGEDVLTGTDSKEAL